MSVKHISISYLYDTSLLLEKCVMCKNLSPPLIKFVSCFFLNNVGPKYCTFYNVTSLRDMCNSINEQFYSQS